MNNCVRLILLEIRVLAKELLTKVQSILRLDSQNSPAHLNCKLFVSTQGDRLAHEDQCAKFRVLVHNSQIRGDLSFPVTVMHQL